MECSPSIYRLSYLRAAIKAFESGPDGILYARHGYGVWLDLGPKKSVS